MLKQTQPRVGILTLTQSENYGTTLQSYATRRIFEEAFADAANVGVVATDVGRVRRRRLLSLANPSNPGFGWTRARNFRHMRSFVHRNVVPRGKIVNIEDRRRALAHLQENYDALISGSDEIWNLASVGTKSLYFIPPEFEGYRASFATSANRIDLSALTEQDSEILRSSLTRYNVLAVRDSNTASLVKKLNPNAVVSEIIDPTLILDPLFPAPLAIRRGTRPRVLVMLKNRMLASRLISNIGKSADIDALFIKHANAKYLKADSEEFVGLFGQYDCVVTDFFHATCMAVRAGTYFVSIDSEPVYATYESKIANLLRKLGLSSQYLNAALESEADVDARLQNLVVSAIRGDAKLPSYQDTLAQEREIGRRIARQIANDVVERAAIAH